VSRHFSLWIVTPPDYPHSRCFEEIALGLQASFTELGFDAPIVTDPAQIKDWAIVLGANLLPRLQVPPRAVDSMKALLEKIPLSEQDKQTLQNFRAKHLTPA